MKMNLLHRECRCTFKVADPYNNKRWEDLTGLPSYPRSHQ